MARSNSTVKRMITGKQEVLIDYTNHRGIRKLRKIIPMSMWYGTTPYHQDPQHFVRAIDVDKAEPDNVRDFAMQDIHSWRNSEKS